MRALGATICLFFVTAVWGMEPFLVRNIEVEGLQRLEEGTVLTYLPVSIGDRLDAQRSRQAIRALYDTELFEDVTLAREGDTLIVRVKERPEIASFSIEGNEQIGGEELKETLAEEGLAEGELYKRALLDQLELELRRQYYANGYYGVRIDTEVTELGGNRVDISIQIEENKVATIEDINIVGNEDFSDGELLEVFELQASKPLYQDPVFWRNRDRYSREKLVGDLESLNSFYQDRGYLRFNVTSIQVSLSPDKRDIYLTINVEEGEPYTVSEYDFAGELIVPEANLRRLVSVREGETFSRKEVEATGNRISSGLANYGYAFAEVDPLTQLDDEKKTVELTFFVEPGKRAYVRRINFTGNDKTNDLTLRREMRQFEGSSFSQASVERSRTRLARLPFMQEVEVETEPVPGSEDLVDVNYSVKERSAGTLQFGVGFSDAQGFLINGSVSHSNFRGTGNRVSMRAESNELAKTFSGSWTDPYATDEGISRTISAYYRGTDQLVRNSSGFGLDTVSGSWTYGLPLTEFVTLRAGLGVSQNEITGNPFFLSNEMRAFIIQNGQEFFSYELRTGLSRDTRNRTFFATRGALTEFSFDLKMPGSDFEYYIANFRHERYFRVGEWSDFLTDGLVLESQLRIADAARYGSGTDVPLYDNFFAGGAGSVRGFENGSLGPRDSFNNPFGGQFLTTLQNELIIPTFLESDNRSSRLTLFYDIGNVFAGADRFEVSELRASAGVAVYWFTSYFGLLRLSYAAYIDSQPGDEVDKFQFSFGVGL